MGSDPEQKGAAGILRCDSRRRMPPLHLQALAAGSRILRRFLVDLTATPENRTYAFFDTEVKRRNYCMQIVGRGTLSLDIDSLDIDSLRLVNDPTTGKLYQFQVISRGP